jgi:hypothetical protein
MAPHAWIEWFRPLVWSCHLAALTLEAHATTQLAGHQGIRACSQMDTAWKPREPLNERFVPYKKQRHSSTLMAGSVQFVSELAVGEWESIKTRSFEMGLHTWWVGGTFIQIRLNLVIDFSAEKAVLRFQNPSGYPPQTYPHVDQKCNKKNRCSCAYMCTITATTWELEKCLNWITKMVKDSQGAQPVHLPPSTHKGVIKS